MAKAIETKAKNIFFFYLLFFGYFDAFNSRGEGFVFWKTSRVAERKWLKKKEKKCSERMMGSGNMRLNLFFLTNSGAFYWRSYSFY
jgi:hypothetical protein